MEVITEFMEIYLNILPVETFIRFNNKTIDDIGISTCSFNDIKTYYQDSYEILISLMHIPVASDNIIERNNYQIFNDVYETVKCYKNQIRNYKWYRRLDNGTKINKLCPNEKFQAIINIPANRQLRNGIGHNNITYDGITQTICVYDIKKMEK